MGGKAAKCSSQSGHINEAMGAQLFPMIGIWIHFMYVNMYMLWHQCFLLCTKVLQQILVLIFPICTLTTAGIANGSSSCEFRSRCIIPSFVAQLALRKWQFIQLHHLDLVNGRGLSGFYCAHFMTCHHALHWVMTCLFDAPNYDASERELEGIFMLGYQVWFTESCCSALETKQTKHEKTWCQFMASLCPGNRLLRLKMLSQELQKFDAIIPLPKIYTPSFSKQTFHISLLVVKTEAFLQPWTCSMSSRTRTVPQVPDDWRRRAIFFGLPFSRLWVMRWKVWKDLDKFFRSWELKSGFLEKCIVNLSLCQVMFLKNFVSRLEGSVC